MFKKIAKWLLLAVLLAIIVLAIVILLRIDGKTLYFQADSAMPQNGILKLYQLEDGSLELHWPEGQNVDVYNVSVSNGANGIVLYEDSFEDQLFCSIPALSVSGSITIKVSAAARYQTVFGDEEKLRTGKNGLEVSTTLTPPGVEKIDCQIDADRGIVTFDLELAHNEVGRLYQVGVDDVGDPVRTIYNGSVTLLFGDGDDYPLPDEGQQYTFAFDVYREQTGLIYYGPVCQKVTISREDFLDDALWLKCNDMGSNVFYLQWNETKCDYYELQIRDASADQWITVYSVPRNGERSYWTGRLDPFVDYEYRVVAKEGSAELGTEQSVAVGSVELSTGASALYATVWPLVKLDLYEDAAMTTAIGTVPAGEAYCVLEVGESVFLVYTDDGMGYINSSYCMINLPEYMGDLCSYDIANSYSSLYTVHEYGIPDVTGTVIKGYEEVEIAQGEYLVPFLYPSAQKLVTAAQEANARGYKLKIYDSYRPRAATQDIYNKANSIINDPLPEYTYSGIPVVDLPILAEDESLTYYIVMTDSGRYKLSNFLAAGTSNHNLGIALDLTLERIHSGVEMEMQTSMHDLSWYSEVPQNNSNAQLLGQIMVEAGFGGLQSEWWHYQDNEAKEQLDLSHLYNGVTSECWVKDDIGWRYRKANGSYYVSCNRTIDGTSYTFDASGYASENSQ